MTAQREAAESGAYWLVRWDGDVYVSLHLGEAQGQAYQECLRVIHGHYGDPHPNNCSVSVFAGHKMVAQVRVDLNVDDAEEWYGWSPAFMHSGGEPDVSPEEMAHLIRRRIEAGK